MIQIVMLDETSQPRGAATSWREAASLAEARGIAPVVEHFRVLLGEEWPGWREARWLALNFWTGFQGGLPEGARLDGLVRMLDGVDGVEQLVWKYLGSPKWPHYASAVTTLELCGRMRVRGVDVALVPTANDSCPDVHLRIDGRCLTAELKALQRVEVPGVHDGLAPLLPQRPDRERLLGKLHKWAAQLLHAEAPTALVVRGNLIFGQTNSDHERNARALASALRARLAGLPHVGAVVAYDEWLWAPPPKSCRTIDDAIFTIDAPDGHARALLVVPNAAATRPLSSRVLSALGGPERLW